MSLAEGATFPSFEAFREAVKSYEEKMGVLFVTTDSLKNNDSSTNKKFPYKSLKYECKQGKSRPSRSKGIRIKTKTIKHGCEASIRARLKREETICLKITMFNDTHNHPVNKEIASSYPENRRIKLDKNDLILLKLQKVKNIDVINYLKKKYEKDIDPESVGYMRKKIGSNPQISCNDIFVSELNPAIKLYKKTRSTLQNNSNDISSPKSSPENNLNKKASSNPQNNSNDISSPKSSPEHNLNKKASSNPQNSCNDISTPKSSSEVDYLSMKITSIRDKYICSHILMNDISSYLCPLPTEEFKTKMRILQDLLHEWRQGQNNNLIKSEQDEITTSNSQQKKDTQILEENEVHLNKETQETTEYPSSNFIGAQEEDDDDDDDDDESEVIHKESEDESEVIHKESEVINNESEVINKENEVIHKESEVINNESEVIHKKNEDESEVIQNVQLTCEFKDDLPNSELRKIVIKRDSNLKQNLAKRKRKPPACFSSLKMSEKKRIIFKAVVKEEYWSFENIDDNTYINSPRNMGSVVMDEQCNLEIIKDHFSAPTYSWIKACVGYKVKLKLYVCPECERVDDEELKMIGCDQCLNWYHYECVFMTPRKVPKNWYCMDCCTDY